MGSIHSQYYITLTDAFSVDNLIRFRDPVHLAHAAVPLLVDLERSISSTDTLGKASVFQPTSTELPDNLTVKLYSGHDITVLALLYALKADIIEESDGFFWPDYGKLLMFSAIWIVDTLALLSRCLHVSVE